MTGAKVVNNAVIKDINKVVLVFQVCLKPSSLIGELSENTD